MLAGITPDSGQRFSGDWESTFRALGGCCCPSPLPAVTSTRRRPCVLLLSDIFSVCACACEHLWQVSILIVTSWLGDIYFCSAERRVLEENRIEIHISSILHELYCFQTLIIGVQKKLVVVSTSQYLQVEYVRLVTWGCFLSLEFHRWPTINVFKWIKYNSPSSNGCFINYRSGHTIIPVPCVAKQMVCPNNSTSLG